MTFDPNAAAAADSGIYGLPFTPEEAHVVLIPVPWEVTTSYRAGTAQGPNAILEASKQVAVFDVETGTPYRAGIAMLEPALDVEAWNAEGRALAERVIAAAGVVEGDPILERSLGRVNTLGTMLNEHVQKEAERWLDAGKLVGL